MDETQTIGVPLDNIYGSQMFSIEELSLSANQLKEDMMKNKFNWNKAEFQYKLDDLSTGDVTLRPLEIKTYGLYYHNKHPETIKK